MRKIISFFQLFEFFKLNMLKLIIYDNNLIFENLDFFLFFF